MVRSRVLLGAFAAVLAITLAGCDETGVYSGTGYVAPFYAGGYYGAPYYGGGYYGGGYYGGGYYGGYGWRGGVYRRAGYYNHGYYRGGYQAAATVAAASTAPASTAAGSMAAGSGVRPIAAHQTRRRHRPRLALIDSRPRQAPLEPAGALRALRTARSTDSARRTTG